LNNKRNSLIQRIKICWNQLKGNVTCLIILCTLIFIILGFLLFLFHSKVSEFNKLLNINLKQYFPDQYNAIFSVTEPADRKPLSSFIVLIYTIGSVILATSRHRLSSEINPYTASEYINTKLLGSILLIFFIISIYAHLANLYALEVIFVVLSLFNSLAMVTSIYLFHSPDRVALVSANIIIREGKIRVRKIQFPKEIDWKKIRHEACCWHALLTNTSNSSLSIMEKADHQALVMKNLTKINKYADGLVPFIIGFFSVIPYSNVESKVQEMYIRFLAKELVTHKEFKETNYYKHLLGGIMVGYIIHKVLTGSFKAISNKNLSEGTKTDEGKRIVELVKDCFSDFNNMVCENDDANHIENSKTILSECTYIWLVIFIIFYLIMQDELVVKSEFEKLLIFADRRYHLEKVEYEVTQSYYRKKWIIKEAFDLWDKLMFTDWFKPVNQEDVMGCASLLHKFVYKRYCYTTVDENWVVNGTSELWDRLMITEWFKPVIHKGNVELACLRKDFEKYNKKLKEERENTRLELYANY